MGVRRWGHNLTRERFEIVVVQLSGYNQAVKRRGRISAGIAHANKQVLTPNATRRTLGGVVVDLDAARPRSSAQTPSRDLAPSESLWRPRISERVDASVCWTTRAASKKRAIVRDGSYERC